LSTRAAAAELDDLSGQPGKAAALALSWWRAKAEEGHGS
jgi:hypothetical protein